MGSIFIPENYESKLDLQETEIAIKLIKDTFQMHLANALCLKRVTDPLFVKSNLGLNDTLTGVEKPVSFVATTIGQPCEIVHSLAKWKRMKLHDMRIEPGYGIYTDMNAIRADEELDNIHSLYVDQWDWEKVISKKERTIETLKDTVNDVYKCLRTTEKYLAIQYDYIDLILPKEIFFITTQELEDMYPGKTAKEREYLITKEKIAVCIMQIGDKLASGEPHDGRAPDYDDWELNGDIIVYYPVLDIALELSSMGIRVDEESLMRQLEIAGCPERAELDFQRALLNHELPYTIGGGLGQSRICMFFLRKAHIGEVQSSIWPDAIVEECEINGIKLL